MTVDTLHAAAGASKLGSVLLPRAVFGTLSPAIALQWILLVSGFCCGHAMAALTVVLIGWQVSSHICACR